MSVHLSASIRKQSTSLLLNLITSKNSSSFDKEFTFFAAANIRGYILIFRFRNVCEGIILFVIHGDFPKISFDYTVELR